MGQAKAPAAPRAARPKGSKFTAKKAANEVAASLRLARLQAEQREMNEMRASGIVASDTTLRLMIAERERAAEVAKAKEVVEGILSGPRGEKARKWIGRGLSGDPCRVAMILKNWEATQG